MRKLTLDVLKSMTGTQIHAAARKIAIFINDQDSILRAGSRGDILQMVCEELCYFKHSPSELRAGVDIKVAVVGRVKNKLRKDFMTNFKNSYDDSYENEIVDEEIVDETVEDEGFDRTIDDIPGFTVLDKIVFLHDVSTDNPHCASTKTLADQLDCTARSIRNHRASARAKAVEYAKSIGRAIQSEIFVKVTEKKIVHDKKESNSDFQRRMLQKSSTETLSLNGLRAFGIR